MPSQNIPTIMFIQDDNIGPWTSAAAVFVEPFRSRSIPVSYQIFPARLTEESAERLRILRSGAPDRIQLGRHGLEHQMLVGGKRVGHEFGHERDYATQRATIRKGREIMMAILGTAFVGRMITPPRHRLNRDTVLAAANGSFDIFSAATYGDGPRRMVYRLGRSLGVHSVAHRGTSYYPNMRPEALIHEVSIIVAVDDGPSRPREVDAVTAEIARASVRYGWLA